MNEYSKVLDERLKQGLFLKSRQDVFIHDLYCFYLNENIEIDNKIIYNVCIEYLTPVDFKRIIVSNRDFTTRFGAMRWIEVQDKLLFPDEGVGEDGRTTN